MKSNISRKACLCYNFQIFHEGDNMPPIAIITDTDSSLPLEEAKKYNIAQVPIIVQFGDDSYRDVYDIDNPAVFGRIDKEGKFPTTAAPSPGQFVEAFKTAFEAGARSVLCFNVSSEVSATYASARTAAETLPGKDIRIIDTRNLCLGQGFMAIAAAEAVAKGASEEEAIAAAESTCERSHLFASLATLKYLAMSGRVGQLAAGIANLMDVKPILTVKDGKLQLLERIRTQSKSWSRTVDVAVEANAGHKIERMVIIHVKALEAAGQFEKLVRAALPCPEEILYAEMNPGLSIHSGSGLVGMVFVTAKQ
jgi:DegV family protein with EDD domain